MYLSAFEFSKEILTTGSRFPGRSPFIPSLVNIIFGENYLRQMFKSPFPPLTTPGEK
jgi:hypothetical protein